MEDVEKRALQAIKKKKNLTFHWRGGYLTREKLTELLQLLEGMARGRGKYARLQERKAVYYTISYANYRSWFGSGGKEWQKITA